MSDLNALDMGFVRGHFPGLADDWAYFDNAGGSQIAQPALDRITRFLTERHVQIGGSYPRSLAAAAALQEAREDARTLVNAARPEEIVFGPSTTALLQYLATSMRSQLSAGDELIVTVSDHESNIGPWMRLEEFGIVIKVWPLNRETLTLDLVDLERLMSPRTRLVCIHHVSNILGVINPVRDIADFVHERGARLCVDAVAYAPHRAIDVRAWDVDYYVFSLYKTYGPHHALMYGKFDHLLELDTLYHYFYGKDKVPGKLEPGNANYEMSFSVCGIVDYLTAVARKAGAAGGRRAEVERFFALATKQENALAGRLTSYLAGRRDCRIIAPETNVAENRIPTIAFKLAGQDSGEVARAMEKAQVAVRFGDFHSRRLIEHLGLSDGSGVVRASLVHYNTVEEVDRMIARLDEAFPLARAS